MSATDSTPVVYTNNALLRRFSACPLLFALAGLPAACGSSSNPGTSSGSRGGNAGQAATLQGGSAGALAAGGRAAQGGSGSAGSAAGLGGSNASGGAGTAPEPAYVEPVESVDLNELPTEVVTVQLEVDAAAIASLDQNPFEAADVTGTFTDASGQRYEGISVNYRGAYQLQNLIRSRAPQRNWKIKFAKDKMYRARREWNFNYEPHFRQKLAYDLMRFAGLKVPAPRHVRLVVNGQPSGLFLEYEDPDNKDFLKDKFGDNDGDLYKASTDLPGQTPYFGTTEYLGDADAAYLKHYNKKTNNDLNPEDYSILRTFLQGLNSTADEALPAWLEKNFDVDKFVHYLAVDNFISGWDGLPQRPKNYWLYQVPAAGRWVFLPWDLDATFQVSTTRLNPMGTNASVFYQLDAFEQYQLSTGEGRERPIVRRLLKIPAIRSAYIQAYKTALGSFLQKSYLLARIDSLEALLERYASPEELELLQEARDEMRQFVDTRYDRISSELASQ